MSGETQIDRQDPQVDIMAQRLQIMQDWLQQEIQHPLSKIIPLAGDASFRRYFRVQFADGQQRVVMDAPPQRESCANFVNLTRLLQQYQIGVPIIYAQDLRQGFLVLQDFGDRLLLPELNAASADVLYKSAFSELLKIHRVPQGDLLEYSDKLYRQEMQLFIDWYLGKHKKLALSAEHYQTLQKLFDLLIESANAQPKVCVHRDFHSRNLLVLEEGGLGVLDFQDAVWGPVTYDVVSLLKDCYIEWPEEQRQQWLQQFYAQLPVNLRSATFAEFKRWFDWMGLQRHLKCVGIFTRLHIRDQKSGYLADIPRVLRYAREVAEHYVELNSLLAFLV